jgi:hypothetical protein
MQQLRELFKRCEQKQIHCHVETKELINYSNVYHIMQLSSQNLQSPIIQTTLHLYIL